MVEGRRHGFLIDLSKRAGSHGVSALEVRQASLKIPPLRPRIRVEVTVIALLRLCNRVQARVYPSITICSSTALHTTSQEAWSPVSIPTSTPQRMAAPMSPQSNRPNSTPHTWYRRPISTAHGTQQTRLPARTLSCGRQGGKRRSPAGVRGSHTIRTGDVYV